MRTGSLHMDVQEMLQGAEPDSSFPLNLRNCKISGCRVGADKFGCWNLRRYGDLVTLGSHYDPLGHPAKSPVTASRSHV